MPRWPAKPDPPGPAPASTADLCPVCPPQDLDPSTTAMACPHGSWTFTPAPDDDP